MLCSGKVYFDLMEARDKLNEGRIQIIRLEQLYPFPESVLALELNRFPRPTSCGARKNRRTRAPGTSSPRASSRPSPSSVAWRVPRYAGRPEYASTAAGLMSQHNAELKAFLDAALNAITDARRSGAGDPS